MVELPTATWAHFAGNGAALLAAGWGALWQRKLDAKGAGTTTKPRTEQSYYRALAVGALLGAWLVGSLNTMPSGLTPSHSVAGALAGAIAGVELWKWRHGVRGSTGGAFVLPLALGIMVGRLGCLFAGLADATHGVPTRLPWAVDLGDGVGRHPVQLYESLAMALFLLVWWPARRRRAAWASNHAFHAFVIYYATQRFYWEFLKPYPKVFGSFNLFHLVCLGLVIYGIFGWWRDKTMGCSAPGRALCVPQSNHQPVRDLS
ncbi:MAG: prolipoprotein diacylglyceryl transferase family protein [Cyanobacteriota bacterium]|nr:prolipoprotein diacylglyceryl transferase family protein [Cyanobacteriota bacterium]